MKLRVGHLEGLQSYERKIYSELLGPVRRVGRRSRFLAQAEKFKKQDEVKLPFPQRSAQGFRLTQIASSLQRSQLALIAQPTAPSLATLLQQKLERKYSPAKIYDCSSAEILACVYSLQSHRRKSVWDYWRDGEPLRSDLHGLNRSNLLILDPPQSLTYSSEELTVTAALLKPLSNMETIGERLQQLADNSQVDDTELAEIRLLAAAGLTRVDAIDGGLWLTRE